MKTITINVPDRAEELCEAVNEGQTLVEYVEHHIVRWSSAWEERIVADLSGQEREAILNKGIAARKAQREAAAKQQAEDEKQAKEKEAADRKALEVKEAAERKAAAKAS